MRSRFTRPAVHLATLAVAATTVLTLSPASAAPTPASASGDGWTVTHVAGGYQVSLALDEKLPVVSDAPVIRVDGQDIGFATESADGRTLTAVTTDASVLAADTVESGWSSGPEAAPAGSELTEDQQQQLADLATSLDTETVALDPGATGAHTVTEAEYDFGNSVVDLTDIGGIKGELTGKMYLTSATGARPTVILMHGRHTSCSTGTANPNRWPCGDNQVNVRSYQGYEGTARALASHGYQVLSIAVNAINSNDNQLAADYGASARGQMVLKTLDLLRDATAGTSIVEHDHQTGTDVTLDQALVKATTRADAPAPAAGVTAQDLIGRFDLDHVGIMGHSRGGEGVMSAATLNQGREKPYGIEAVLPLAPVDFGRMTLPDVPMNVVLPYCDGDVSNQQGQHMFDDSRHAFDDNVQRTATWVMGANHNFFNTVWTPGKYPYATSDDWSTRDTTSACATTDESRLSADEQYQVGVSYMTGYFRYVMGGETEFASLFDGSVKPSTPDTEFADVRVMASQPHRDTTMLADFTADSNLVRATGTAKAAVCMNATGVTVPQSVPLCSTTRTASGGYPHWAQMRFGGNVPAFPVTRVTWTDATGALRVTVPKAKRDVRGHTQLTVRTMPDESVTAGTDFTLTVVDGSGATWSVLASEVNALAVNRLPGGSTTLDKLVMQQLTVPTSQITGVDLGDVREIQIAGATGADGTPAGGVHLSDLAFDTPSLGTTVKTQQTTLNLSDVTVDEGNAAGTVDIPVWLNKPSASTVTGYVSSVGSATGTAGIGMQKVSFAPGETCRVVEMPLQGNTVASTTATSRTVLSVTNTQNAVMGADAFGWLTLREDDGVTNGSPAPEVGRQGDACAEAAAARGTATLETSLATDTALHGESVTFTGTGFRAGETVAFTVAGTEVGSAIADSDGTAVHTSDLSPELALGSVHAEAIGAGTGITQQAEFELAAGRLALTTGTASTTYGTGATATATLTTAHDVAEGTVIFSYGTGTGTRTSTATVVDGTASLALPRTLAVGTHPVTVTLTGVEGPAVTATTTHRVTRASSTTTLKASKTMLKVKGKVTLTATVKTSSGVAATGTVTFTNGAKVLGKATIKNGRASLVFTPKAKGTRTLRATWAGNAQHTASTSKVVTVKVTKK